MRSGPKFTLGFLVTATAFLELGLAMGVSFTSGNAPSLVSLSLHSSLEAMCAFAALVSAVLIFMQPTSETKSTEHVWVGNALLVLGILGLVHAGLSPGNHAELFTVISSLAGGAFCALIYLPRRLFLASQRWSHPILFSALLGILSIVILSLPEPPQQFYAESRLTETAQKLNILGGFLFILAALNFGFRFFKKHWPEDLLFSSLCLFSGLSTVLLPLFVFWTRGFWIWHGVKLLGYVSALAYVFVVHRRTHHNLRLSEQTVRAINETLEQKVIARSQALAERAEALAKSQAELQNHQNLLQYVLNYLADGVVMADAAGRILLSNPAAQRILQLSPETTHLNLGDNLLSPSLKAALAGNLISNREVTNDERFQIGNPLILRMSARPILDNDANTIGGLMVFRDVTQTRAAERAAKASNERFETLAKVTDDVVWDYDLVHGRVWHNDAWSRWFGRKIESQCSIELWIDNLHAEDRERVSTSLKRFLQSPGTIWTEEFRFRRADGSYAYVLDRGYIIRNDQGHPVRMIGVLMDITQSKENEIRLREQARALARSNKDLEQFAYVASHDLKEPLRMVTSYVQLLRKRYGGKLDSDAHDFINYASEGASRMHNLIDDLLAYAQVDRKGVAFAPLDCNSVIREVLADLQTVVTESKAQIRIGHLPQVLGDKIQVGQLFQNLIVNALKYRGEASPLIDISAALSEGVWVFSVKDNGIGMAHQLTDRIFNLFQRLHTKKEYPGTGIGLAICKRIVERHGGKIWVDSSLGVGSTFYFAIPDISVEVEHDLLRAN